VDFPTAQDAVSCLGYSIATIDKDGKVTRPSEISIIFLSSGSGRFYTDSSCNINKATDQISFGPENGIVKLFYLNPTPQVIKLAAYAPEAWKWAHASFDLEIVPGPTAQLKFSSLQAEITADDCFLLTVTAADGAGNPRRRGPALDVSLSALHGSFFTDATCVTATVDNKMTIAAEASTGDFYFKNTRSPGDPVNVMVAAQPTWKAGAIFIGVKPTTISQIAFTVAPVSLQVNQCTMFMVGALDRFDNAAPVVADTVISMTTNAPVGNGRYYADAACTMLLTGDQLTIPMGEVSMKAYFKPINQTTNPVTLSATTTLDITNKTVSLTGLAVAP
jgi:hypothetical protein